MKKFWISIIVLTISSYLFAESDTKLSYQSFVDYARSGKIKTLEISEFGINDMKATILKDGKEVEYIVDKPYRAGDDIVFIDFLKKNKIKYEILEKNHRHLGLSWASFLPLLGFLLFPFLFMLAIMILVIITMIRTGRVERLLEQLRNNQSEKEDKTT